MGETDPFERVPMSRPRGKGRLPTDIADAAEAALDDMLSRAPEPEPEPELDALVRKLGEEDEPRTETRARSHDEIVVRDEIIVHEEDALPARAASAKRANQMPLPAPPRTTSVHTLAAPPSPAPRASPAPRITPPPRTTPIPTARPKTVHGEPTSAETPHARLVTVDHTTSFRDSPLAETAPVPAALELDLDSGPVATDPDALVPVRPELPVLQVAVHEDAVHLASAQGAVVAAGHVVDVAAAGRDGVARIVSAIRGGALDAVIVALPGGEEIVSAALALEPRRPIVIGALAGRSVDAVQRAHAAGCDLAIVRPHDVDRLAPILLAAGRILFEKRVAVAARGAEQVLRARLDELADPDPRGLLPFEMFQRVLELEIKRAKRFEYPLSVALFAVEVAPPPPPPGIRGILRARAGTALIHAVRDIDIATQLDHERFLVLLPYTDLKGAAGVGRRVIAAVAAGDPVVAAGRSFPPRVVGAVAGALPGQALSFAKLMKDATRALEQARRDGAELAVQP